LTLSAGNRLGPYEIASKLGEGGMGELAEGIPGIGASMRKRAQ
jgi:hypothetical protein